MQVKERKGELEILKSNFIHCASGFLRNTFVNLVDFMLNDKNYFSQVFGFTFLIYYILILHNSNYGFVYFHK